MNKAKMDWDKDTFNVNMSDTSLWADLTLTGKREISEKWRYRLQMCANEQILPHNNSEKTRYLKFKMSQPIAMFHSGQLHMQIQLTLSKSILNSDVVHDQPPNYTLMCYSSMKANVTYNPTNKCW